MHTRCGKIKAPQFLHLFKFRLASASCVLLFLVLAFECLRFGNAICYLLSYIYSVYLIFVAKSNNEFATKYCKIICNIYIKKIATMGEISTKNSRLNIRISQYLIGANKGSVLLLRNCTI